MSTQETRERLELLQSALDLLILRTLIFGPQHGQGIARAIQQTSQEELLVEHGALYPALQRLEARLEQCKVGNLVKQPQSPILFAEIIRCGFTADISFLRLFPRFEAASHRVGDARPSLTVECPAR
jgi:hypothetical protein